MTHESDSHKELMSPLILKVVRLWIFLYIAQLSHM